LIPLALEWFRFIRKNLNEFYLDNVMTIFNRLRRFWFQIILHATFSIDSFFLLR
jgi:hypothetical protein